ncbi:beta-N-acetylhexosaminidase [Ruminococcus sp. YE71]|uniref:glycoside hydrolase family 3 N-terminal domain-containing protein n=1 Tax=unclassified Ruminococcus TaxID=2608920 RepID=UPI0008879324|nr:MULTISPECIES: glycoside hydrolase family 3 protein [unclassified Ruminococcus]SDA23981.1 beta-N-acetylhexosaminidase [Ruminococcus sp. YE78]SFW40818.1 beta-N-acetylhexosaminidase [Ruminococcus sp. YE71]
MNRRSGKQLMSVLLAVFCVLAVGLGVMVLMYMAKGKSSGIEKNAAETSDDTATQTQTETAAQQEQVSETVSQEDAVPAAAVSETGEDSKAEPQPEKKDEIRTLIDGMSLHEKVCQLFIVTPESLTGYDVVTQAGDATEEALEKYPVGGIIYFAQNMEDYTQLKDMISATKEFAAKSCPTPLFVSVDEEGGDVARCAETVGTTIFQPMYTYKGSTTLAHDNACTIAEDISKLGFNLDFAPVADTWSNPENTVIGQRAYSDDFEEAAELVASAVKGFHDGGVLCTLKHFPGHGNTAEDSHYTSAYSGRTVMQLEQNEYLPFESGIEVGADMVMVGHITVPSIDEEPASVSSKIITGELREKLGFKGVIITDSLAMGAVADNYESGELAVKVLQAGGDILLCPADLDEAVNGIEAAVSKGTIEESRIDESLYRILTLKKHIK